MRALCDAVSYGASPRAETLKFTGFYPVRSGGSCLRFSAALSPILVETFLKKKEKKRTFSVREQRHTPPHGASLRAFVRERERERA